MLLTKEDTEPSILIGQIEVITLFDRHHHDWSTVTLYVMFSLVFHENVSHKNSSKLVVSMKLVA
jgi:hypothetical protein